MLYLLSFLYNEVSAKSVPRGWLCSNQTRKSWFVFYNNSNNRVFFVIEHTIWKDQSRAAPLKASNKWRVLTLQDFGNVTIGIVYIQMSSIQSQLQLPDQLF